MDTSEIIMMVAGAAAVAGTYWYFFGQKDKSAAEVAGAVQEITITVKGGYSPDTVVVKVGMPVRMNFKRDEEEPGSEQIVFGGLDVVRDLPPFQTTPVEFTPNKIGEFPFISASGAYRGLLIVEPLNPL